MWWAINDADCSGPTRNSDFSQSTGNCTNNFDAMIRQHTKRDKVLKNIELVDRNYALENNLVESERRTTVLIEQNWLLQDHLAAGNQVERAAGAASEDRMEDDELADKIREDKMYSFNKGLIEIYRSEITDQVQKIVFEAFIDKGYTTSRALATYFDITHTSAYYLIKDLKQNLNKLQYRYEMEPCY